MEKERNAERSAHQAECEREKDEVRTVMDAQEEKCNKEKEEARIVMDEQLSSLREKHQADTTEMNVRSHTTHARAIN